VGGVEREREMSGRRRKEWGGERDESEGKKREGGVAGEKIARIAR